jgi:hypothetical protein
MNTDVQPVQSHASVELPHVAYLFPCQACKHPLAAHLLPWPLRLTCVHYLAEDDNHQNTSLRLECYMYREPPECLIAWQT